MHLAQPPENQYPLDREMNIVPKLALTDETIDETGIIVTIIEMSAVHERIVIMNVITVINAARTIVKIDDLRGLKGNINAIVSASGLRSREWRRR